MFRLLEILKRSAVLAAAAAALAVFVAGAAGAATGPPSFAATGAIDGRISVVADFNGDGKPDLAVLTPGRIAERNQNLVVVPAKIGALLGDGTGGFRVAPRPLLDAGGLTVSVAAGDFNGDGKTDLAVANHAQQDPVTNKDLVGRNDVRVFIGNGAGGFASAPPHPLGFSPSALSVADLNGDGKDDLLGGAGILLGDGGGGFAPAPGSPVKAGFLAVGDFNGDGKPDLVVSQGKKLSVLLGDGAGGFHPAPGSPITIGADPYTAAIGDVNHDGKQDVVIEGLNADILWRTSILLGDGSGRFRLAPGSPLKIGAESLALADFNGDHKLDLVVKEVDENLTVLAGNGKGAFRRAAAMTDWIEQPGGIVAAADLDGNGKVDLVMEHELGLQPPSTPRTVPGRALPPQADLGLSTRGAVGALAADGKRVAFFTREGKCGEIVVWTAPARMSARFEVDACPSTRGCGCAAPALGGGQLAWQTESGGNDLEQWVSVAKLPRGRTTGIEHVASDGGTGEGSWVGNLLGGEPILAYNRWSVDCTPGSGKYSVGCDWGREESTKAVVRILSGRRVVVAHGLLTAVGGGRMAVESEGAVNLLRPNGSRVATVPVSAIPPHGVALSSTRLAVQTPLTLDLYDPATGRKAKSLPLGLSAVLELAGVNAKLALLRGPDRVVLVRLSDGKLISLPRRDVVASTLTEAGLFYACNTPKAAMKGHVVFEPTAKLLRRF